MHTIWKYELKIADEQTIRMPIGATILSVGLQGGLLVMWAKVDPAKWGAGRAEDRTIYVMGTGNPFDEDAKQFIGTVQMPNGLVWHVFT